MFKYLLKDLIRTLSNNRGCFGGGASKAAPSPQVVYQPAPQPVVQETAKDDKKLQQGRASSILSSDTSKANASKKSLLGE